MSGKNYYKRTIHKHLLSSSFLQEERSLRVYLPPGYNDMVTYPVFYCQDGEQFFNFGRIATIANQLILDEDVDPFIIVGVDVNMEHRTADYSPDGDRFAAYTKFFIQEMMVFVEDHYPVRTSPDERILAGDSLGGTVSLHLALEHPELFHNVISLSGAFLHKTQEAIAREEDLSWLRIYQLIGLNETEVKTDRGVFDFLTANRKVHELLTARNASLLYEEKPGEHVWGFWQKELGNALRWCLEAN